MSIVVVIVVEDLTPAEKIIGENNKNLNYEIYPNVTQKNLNSLRNLAGDQKNQQPLKIKIRILKQTHDIKLAENLSPITEKLEEVNETTKKLGELIGKSRPEKNITQPAIEHTPRCQPMKSNEGVIYDTELENTLKNLKTNTGFFQTSDDSEHGWVWNGYLVKIMGGTREYIILILNIEYLQVFIKYLLIHLIIPLNQ